jgi:transglutaminase-like putative cysteine protease
VSTAPRRVAAVAAGSTLLAALPLATLFQTWTWFVRAVLIVAVVGTVGVLTRSLRHRPAWLPTVAMLGGLGFGLTWLFPSQQEILPGVPSGATLAHFVDLFETASWEMPQYRSPVTDRPAFLFLATFGVGTAAVLVDLLAVGLRRPALAGLPMLAIYAVPVAVEPDGTSIVAFVPGALGFLWLLGDDQAARVRRFGRRFTGDGRAVDPEAPLALATAGRRLALIGASLAALIPLAMPGMTGGLLRHLPETGNARRFGDTDGGTVDLFMALSGTLNRDRSFAMLTVSTTDPQPHYLRIAVADQLDINGFSNRSMTTGQPVTSGVFGPMPTEASRSTRYRATVEVHDFNMRYLPVYLHPTAVKGVGTSWWYDPNTSVVYSNRRNTRAPARYEFEYARAEYSPAALHLARSTTHEQAVHRQFAWVPTRVRAVDELVARLTTGLAGPYEKVLALVNHFSTDGFEYSVTTEPGTSGSEIEDFLINKKGFCVQYAAALAWLVRAAGIPARVAVGFTRGSGARPGSAVTLTNFNLHAWTEAYFEGFGWVPFDPTPAGSVAGLASPKWAPKPTGPDPTPAPPDDVPNPNRSGTVQPSVEPSAPVPGPQPPTPNPPGFAADIRTLLWWLVAGVAGLTVLAAPAISRRLVRRQRLRALPTRQYVNAVWDEFRDVMIDYRVPVEAAETPRRTAARVIRHAHLTGTAARGVQLLAEAESYARYAREPIHQADLRSPLTTARAALAAQTSRRTRLAAVLAPPSVLRRWRQALLAVGARVADASTALGQQRGVPGKV